MQHSGSGSGPAPHGEERFRRLVDALAEGVVECAADGSVQVWNRAAERMFAVSRDEIVGRHWMIAGAWELLHEDGTPCRVEELPMARTLRTGEACTGVVVGMRRPDRAGLLWLSLNSRSLGEDGDLSRGAVASFADITHQKCLMDQLEQRKRQEQVILDAVPAYVWVKDRDNRVRRINQHAAQGLGMAAEQVVGRSTFDLYPQQAAAYHRDDLEVIASGQPKIGILEPIETAAGERRWLQTSKLPHYAEDGGIDGVIVLSIDVTEHRRSEEALRREISAQRVAEAERERLREKLSHSLLEWQQTFDSISMPVFLLDGAGAVGRLNDAARTLAGLSFADCLHQRLAQLGRGEPWATAARLAAAVQQSGPATGLAEQVAWEGRSWDIRVQPLPAGGGVIVTLHDQTDVVRLQESLRRSATMSAMGMLVAGVAHEVRNPLFGLAALLDTFESQPEPRQPFPVEPFRRGLTRLQNLMQQLLDYAQPAPLLRSTHDLGKTLHEAIEVCGDLARARHVAVGLEVPADLPSVHIDDGRMLQVFSNLLDNAIRHSPAGGRVTLTASATARWVDCNVDDEGPGVAVEDLASIFEPFFTRRRGGTGLGLAIVQKIVMEHGGKVICCPRDGGGTSMLVRLPLGRA
jgi:PAS domain S-box-containing protein